jgi:hypothetical protein
MGRKPKLTKPQADEVREMYSGVWSIAQIARYFKVDQAIIHKVLDRKGPYNDGGKVSMTITYRYTVEGVAADDQSWSASGEVTVGREGDFQLALLEAQREAFTQLTQGRAVYGKPGVGCRGPYKITKLTIERDQYHDGN